MQGEGEVASSPMRHLAWGAASSSLLILFPTASSSLNKDPAWQSCHKQHVDALRAADEAEEVRCTSPPLQAACRERARCGAAPSRPPRSLNAACFYRPVIHAST